MIKRATRAQNTTPDLKESKQGKSSDQHQFTAQKSHPKPKNPILTLEHLGIAWASSSTSQYIQKCQDWNYTTIESRKLLRTAAQVDHLVANMGENQRLMLPMTKIKLESIEVIALVDTRASAIFLQTD